MSEIFIRARIGPAETKDVPIDDVKGTTDITALYLNVTEEIPTIVQGKFMEGLIFLLKGHAGKEEVGTRTYDGGIITRMPNRTLILEEPIQLTSGGKWCLRFMNQSTYILTLDMVVYCTKGKAAPVDTVPLYPLSQVNLLAMKTEVPKTRPPEKKAPPPEKKVGA